MHGSYGKQEMKYRQYLLTCVFCGFFFGFVCAVTQSDGLHVEYVALTFTCKRFDYVATLYAFHQSSDSYNLMLAGAAGSMKPQSAMVYNCEKETQDPSPGPSKNETNTFQKVTKLPSC